MRKAVFEFLAAHRRDGARQVDALLRTVTDDDRLFELDGVLLEVDRDFALRRGHRHFLGDVAQIGGVQDDFAGGNVEREAAGSFRRPERLLPRSAVAGHRGLFPIPFYSGRPGPGYLPTRSEPETEPIV